MISPMQDLMASYGHAWPEFILVGFALIAVIIGAYSSEKVFGWLSALAIAALITAGGVALANSPVAPVQLFQGSMVVDGVSVIAKVLIALSAAATLALGADHFMQTNERRFEFPALVVLAVLGMFVMVSAQCGRRVAKPLRLCLGRLAA
jgi:NADH-quinone oxidoreductase subunit N